MDLQFNEITIETKESLLPYFNLRELISCEYNFNTLFMWAKHNSIKYALQPNYVVFSEIYNDQFILLMPLCKEEHFKEAFEDMRTYCENKGLAFNVYVTDDIFAEFVKNKYPDEFEITTDRDLYDYIYDADKLRTLSGKKYNKKRNHLNAFHAEYEGRFFYRQLTKEDKKDVCHFLRGWKDNKDDNIEDVTDEFSDTLESELASICKLLSNMDRLDIHCGGIFIDDRLEAFSIGSGINHGKEAVIHVEKANDNIRGLYQLINQYFLQQEFPNVELVNREEDLGIEGLRKAKLSYYPIQVLEKYNILKK